MKKNQIIFRLNDGLYLCGAITLTIINTFLIHPVLQIVGVLIIVLLAYKVVANYRDNQIWKTLLIISVGMFLFGGAEFFINESFANLDFSNVNFRQYFDNTEDLVINVIRAIYLIYLAASSIYIFAAARSGELAKTARTPIIVLFIGTSVELMNTLITSVKTN